MKINDFSEKQKEIIRFTKDNNRILICDGAVRSGKTMAMSLSFILWAMANFNDTNFAICGKTVSSAERNIVRPIQTLIQGIFEFKYMISNRCLVITSGKKQNFFYCFGGKDESSYQLIQGLSAGGVLFDEVALMPKSFVEQAIARTLSYNNSKLWFNCNPDSASHWFYKEWIEDRKPKTKHLHFLMEDNPIITDEEIETAKKLYTGVFYERYILGRWVTAEGIIFRKFAEETERYLTDTKDTNINTFSKITIGVDFGGTGSLTTFVATGFIGYYQELVVLEEYKTKGENIDTLQICEGFIDFYNLIMKKYNRVDWVFCDSASPTLINSFRTYARANGAPYLKINPVKKNEIADRPILVDLLLNTDRLKINKGCDNVIFSLKNLRWDKKKANIPEDNNISNINDWWDAFNYSFIDFRRLIERGLKQCKTQ